jgi:hypothetical protein
MLSGRGAGSVVLRRDTRRVSRTPTRRHRDSLRAGKTGPVSVRWLLLLLLDVA